MKIRQYKDRIELVAENKKETEMLRLVFNGISQVYSFGYDRRMPNLKDCHYWAQRQVLVLKAEQGREFVAKPLMEKWEKRYGKVKT